MEQKEYEEMVKEEYKAERVIVNISALAFIIILIAYVVYKFS